MRTVLIFGLSIGLALTGCGFHVTGSSDGDDQSAGEEEEGTGSGSGSTTRKPAPAPAGSSTGTPQPKPADPASDSTMNQPPPPSSEATPETMPAPTPVEPLTVISPSHASGTLVFQRAIDWTIGVSENGVPIFYTTDGSTPTKSSPSQTGNVTLRALPNNTVVKWIVGDSNVVRTMKVGVNQSLQNNTHWLVENVRFDTSGGPILKAPPNTRVFGRASAVVWNGPSQSQCPNCIDQVTIGIDKAAACVVSVNPQTYPGQAGTNVAFSVMTPATKGVYKLKAGFTQQFRCSDAIGTNLSDTDIGIVIVE